MTIPAVERHYPGSMTYRTLNRPAVRVAVGVALILSLPLVAMQFTDEVVWSLGTSSSSASCSRSSALRSSWQSRGRETSPWPSASPRWASPAASSGRRMTRPAS